MVNYLYLTWISINANVKPWVQAYKALNETSHDSLFRSRKEKSFLTFPISYHNLAKLVRSMKNVILEIWNYIFLVLMSDS